MAPAKVLTISGALVTVTAALVAILMLASHDATTVLLRLDIMAMIAGVILAVAGQVFSDMRKLFWENARAALRKSMRDDKHAA